MKTQSLGKLERMVGLNQYRADKVRSAYGLLRPRLMMDHEGHANARLLITVGPPGSGKTTLLRQWAGQGPGKVAWLPSGRLESKPGQVFSWFACVLAMPVSEESASTFATLARAAELIEQDHYLVVDDIHLLRGTCAEVELQQLMTLDSPRLHFLVGSREAPSINLAKSELQSAFTVYGDELRFRTNEIDELFRHTYKRPLSPDGVSNLAHVTDGWAAALQLFHLTTKNRSLVEQRRAAESLSPKSRFAQNYLTHHFLAGTSSDMEELLRVTSLLDFLTPSRCDSLLERRDSRILLPRLEQLGVISTDDEGATYRTPRVLRNYLLLALGDMDPGFQADLIKRTAVMLEQEGAIGEGLRVLADGNDWESVADLLRRAGESALLPGSCGWAATMPEEIVADEAWSVLATVREMLDDGRLASADRLAARLTDLGDDHQCQRLAQDFRLQAALWAGSTIPPSANVHSRELRNATHGHPAAAARSLAKSGRPEFMLASGLSLLLAGDQRSGQQLLARAAERLETDPASALAAQLALAVFRNEPAGEASVTMAAEIDAVQRQAERQGLTWLGRLAEGIQLALSGMPSALPAVTSVIAACEDRGDEWGAALIAAAAALLRLRTGSGDQEQLEALAQRFRRLSAGTLEAWTLSVQALVCANLDLPCALENVQSAAAFARTAMVPGALAIAYAAMALQRPEEHDELMRQATETAQNAGLVCRPWTWFAAYRREIVDTPAKTSSTTSGHGQTMGHRYGGQSEPIPGCTGLPSLQITCLGAFALSRDRESVDLSKIRPQARTVLRILCLNAGRLVHRERLAGILWPDLDAPAALHALQVSVSSLRRALQPEGPSEGRQLLVRQGPAYALVLGAGSSFDLTNFDQSLHTASVNKSSGNLLAAVGELRRAVALYRGEVLPEDGPAEWVADIRERYRLRAAEAAATLAGVELSLGNGAAAAAAAARSVEIDPWRDESWRTLVEIFRRIGDPAAAQRAQRRYDLMLNSLGVPVN